MNRQYTIATLGSHSALQILKGAHDEGFKTLAIANRETENLYRSFAFVDEVIGVDKYSDFMDMLDDLQRRKVIVVPHGSFVAYLSLEEHKKMTVPYFGNKQVLEWEASRELQREWLSRANLTLPRQFKSAAEIDRPVIVKLYGAAGGKGYMFIRDTADFEDAHAPILKSSTRSRSTLSAYLSTFTTFIRRCSESSRSCRWTAVTRPTSIRSAAFRRLHKKAWT